MTMIGVAVGLGNVWRFPYMVGEFGGAPFVLFYVLMVGVVGIPALMAEWSLGRMTRRGPVGAFARAGLPTTTDIRRKAPSTAFVCPSDSHAVEGRLRERGILASARGPVIRLAPHFYNTLAEMDVALDALVEILERKT